MAGTTGVDAALLLVALGLAALLVLSVQLSVEVGRWHGRRPVLPVEDRPPPGLGRLVPVGAQVDQECRTGLVALEHWLAARRARP